MAGWTKADYDRDYDIGAEGLWGHPNDRPEVRLHYHHAMISPYLEDRWSHLIPYFSLTASDIVLIVGSGFGWSVEYLHEQLPGITAVGVDISDYIHAEKDLSEEAEFDAAITAAGLDPAGERGQLIKATYPPRAQRSTQVVLQEDAKTNQSRNRIRQALGNVWPTWIFTEDLVNDPNITDQELLDLAGDYGSLPSPMVHIVGGYPPGARTAQQVFDLIGQRTVLVGSTGVQGDVSA